MRSIRIPDSSDVAVAARPALHAGDVVDVACTDLIAKTGQAVGRVEGMVVYVLGPIPGERARARIVEVKAKYAVAELVELLERSPDRREPFCAVFGACGGCQVQHVAYDAQLRWKRGIVENALRRIGGIGGADVAAPVGMRDPRAYRNKMALVATPRGESVGFGFYAARSHDVVTIETCPILAPSLNATVAGLWDAARDPAVGPALRDVRHTIARTGLAAGDTVVSLTTERASDALPRAAAALAGHLPGAVGIANSYEPPSENAVMGRRHATLWGDATIRETIGDVTFRVSPASFFQVNSEMVGRIFGYLAPAIGAEARIVDLYCGAGTFALFFATRGASVIGIEENPNAIREARSNAEANGVTSRTRFLGGRVEATLRSEAGAAALRDAGVVFLDPPRKGSDPETLRAIAAARVPHVWYLSCNPATLARDLATLLEDGYRLSTVQPFDMFPQTGHIEALAALHRPDVAPVAFGTVTNGNGDG